MKIPALVTHSHCVLLRLHFQVPQHHLHQPRLRAEDLEQRRRLELASCHSERLEPCTSELLGLEIRSFFSLHFAEMESASYAFNVLLEQLV
jgi:hypothetical protein